VARRYNEDGTQTLTSEWGRKSLTVGGKVPTMMLEFHLGRTHIATAIEDVRADVSAAIDKAPEPFTEEQRAETLTAAEWIHAENRAEYVGVMSGRL
jgi:hypothetical protein